MAQINLLNEQKIQSLKCPKHLKQKDYRDGLGLYLRVKQDNSKYWFVKLYGAKKANRGIGFYPDIKLAEARKIRDTYREMWEDGKDPSIERKKQKYVAISNLEQTFEHVQEQTYINVTQKKHSERHQRRWKGIYNKYLKHTLGSLPLSDIDDAIILEVVEDIYKHAPQTASKAKSLISVVFNHAIEKKWFRGSNPCKLLEGNSLIKKPQNKRFEYLKEHRVGELIVLLGESKNYVNNTFIYLLMVTGLRVGSLLNAKWSWVQGDVLVIPSKYMKDRKQFRCPLPTQAVTELKLLAKHSVTTNLNDYIFVSHQQDLNKPKSDNTFRNFLRNLLDDNEVTLHGFRTLFNIVLTKSKKFTEERIESQLTHAYTKTTIRKVYLGDEDFLDERRELVQYFSDWADNQAQFYMKAQEVV